MTNGHPIGVCGEAEECLQGLKPGSFLPRMSELKLRPPEEEPTLAGADGGF